MRPPCATRPGRSRLHHPPAAGTSARKTARLRFAPGPDGAWCQVIGQRQDRHGRWCVGNRYASSAIGGREAWFLFDPTRIRTVTRFARVRTTPSELSVPRPERRPPAAPQLCRRLPHASGGRHPSASAGHPPPCLRVSGAMAGPSDPEGIKAREKSLTPQTSWSGAAYTRGLQISADMGGRAATSVRNEPAHIGCSDRARLAVASARRNSQAGTRDGPSTGGALPDDGRCVLVQAPFVESASAQSTASPAPTAIAPVLALLGGWHNTARNARICRCGGGPRGFTVAGPAVGELRSMPGCVC